MTITAAPARPRVVLELDVEALAALDRAAKHNRLSRPAFARTALVRVLRDAGFIASTTATAGA